MAMKFESEMVTEEVDRRDFHSSGSTRCKNRNMSIEEYLQFIDSQNHAGFSVNYLNQIIAMHGYKKIHKRIKTAVISAASSISLVNPRRSTLKENISLSEAEASLESIFMDLNELGWQECSIVSVETICAESKRSAPVPVAASPAVQPAPKRVRVPKPKNEAKRKQLTRKPSDEPESKPTALKPSDETESKTTALKPSDEPESKPTALKPSDEPESKPIGKKPMKEAKLTGVKPKEEASDPKPKRKRVRAPKRVPVKPVENGVASEQGQQRKRAANKRVSKKKCGCTGCASQGPCQFIW